MHARNARLTRTGRARRRRSRLIYPLGGCLPLVLFAIVACEGPTGLLPGGALGDTGRPTAAPERWDFASSEGLLQLETAPESPYSVNLAYTVLDGRLYVNAGGTETRWAQHIARDPAVRVRLDERLYDLRARRVSDPAELEAFAEAWTRQSFFRRDPRRYDEVWLFELTRSP